MSDPIGLNPTQYQYLYRPEASPAVNSQVQDPAQQSSGSISVDMTVDSKSKAGNTLRGRLPKDCKT